MLLLKYWSPNVADEKADVLWHSVVFDDLDGLPDASGMPWVDRCDELGCLPVDLVVLDVRVLDDGGLLEISSAAMCSVFLQSATIGDQYYRLKDLLYPKSITHTRLRDRLYPKSTTLLPLCLLTTDSVQWAHTPLPQPTMILVSQFPPARLNELILHSWDDPPAVYLSSSIFQSPAFSRGRSELTDRNVELYPQFFLELITTQLRFHMVSPQLVLLIILTMQSYKFYLSFSC